MKPGLTNIRIGAGHEQFLAVLLFAATTPLLASVSLAEERSISRDLDTLSRDTSFLDLPLATRIAILGATHRHPSVHQVTNSSVEQAKLTASDGAAVDAFGSVAVDGDTVVVGALSADNGSGPPDQGSAYVFVKPAGGWNGPLQEQAKLIASDGAEGDRFGQWVAVCGDTVIVGAFRDDFGTNMDQGSAYVFVKPAGGWSGNLTEQAKLTASDGTAGDKFGYSVAVKGDTMVVGAYQDDIGNNSDQGSAYVFSKPANGWSGLLQEQAKLTASDGAIEDWFGVALAIDSGTIVIGAYRDDVGSNPDQGSAYVFVEPAGGWSGNLTEQAKLTASDGEYGDWFGGLDVSVSGDVVVAGAPFDDLSKQTEGSAYVFVKPIGGWNGNLTEQAKLTASDGALQDHFGVSVDIDGNTVLIGANYANSAYVYLKPTSGWSGQLQEQAKLTASDGVDGSQGGDIFGAWVRLRDDTLLVGAPHDDIGGNYRQGSAYVFSLALVVPTPTPTLTPTSTDTPTATPTPTPLNLPGGGSVVQQLTVTDQDRAVELTFQVVAPSIPGGCQVSVELQPPTGPPTSFAMTANQQMQTIEQPQPGVWTITAQSGTGCPDFSYYLFARTIPKVGAVRLSLLVLAFLGVASIRLKKSRLTS